MARKKKSQEVVVPLEAPEDSWTGKFEEQKYTDDHADEPQPKVLTRDELNKLQIAQLQMRAAQAEMNLQMLQRDLFLKQVDPEGKLKTFANVIRTRADELSHGQSAYAQITKEIEDRLGINLKEYAYNDETGVLQAADQ